MRPQVSGFVDNNDANHAIIEKENFVGCFYYITVNTLHLHLYYSYTFTTLHMCMYIHCTCCHPPAIFYVTVIIILNHLS